MSFESNAGSRRTEGGLASTLNNLTLSHQPRQSEHLVSFLPHQRANITSLTHQTAQ